MCSSPFFFFEVKMRDEAKFQRELVELLEKTFPGCIVMKNDPTYIQGIPDLTMIFKGTCVTFECKRSAKERKQPNQQWYVDQINNMGGIAYFIYPENMMEVINDISRKLAT